MTPRDDTCWNCLEHKDTRYMGHGWFICEVCSVRWRRQPQQAETAV